MSRPRKRPRPTYLSDAILTKAAEAGNQRLIERVNKMKTEFAATVTTRATLRRKALIWIETKAINETFVTLSQFASAMKVKRADAAELVGKLIRFKSTTDEIQNTFFIFVEGNQLPDWIREHLNKQLQTALLIRARMRYTSLLDRQVHDEVLAETYGSDFYDYLSKVYLFNEYCTMQSVIRAWFDNVGEAPMPIELCLDGFKNPGWAISCYGYSNRRVSTTLPMGTRVELSFGSVKMDVLEGLQTDKPQLLEHRPHRDELKAYTADQIIEYYNAAQKLVNEMFDQGLHLVNSSTTYSVVTKRHRTSYLFARQDDLASSVRVTLPWDHLLFRKVK